MLGVVVDDLEIQIHPLGKRRLVEDVEDQVLGDGEASHQSVVRTVFGNVANPARENLVDAFVGDVIAVYANPSRGESSKADQGLRQLGLAVALDPGDGVDLARANRKADVVHDDLARLIDHSQRFDLQDRLTGCRDALVHRQQHGAAHHHRSELGRGCGGQRLPVLLTVDKGIAAPGEPILQVESLRVVDEAGQVVVDDVSFSVRSGEIYAIAGVQGNGQTELTESLIGLRRLTSGRVRIDGDDVTDESIDEILARGVGYVPEDRSHDGMVGGFTIAENLVLDIFDQAPFAKGMNLDLKVIDDNAEHRVQEFDIRTSSIRANASTLF